jgi:hypothetical protein
VYETSLSYIHDLSVYWIGGKDLVYYGEGIGGGKVCVFDPSAGAETVLIASGLPRATPAGDIVNVKVGGIGVGQMHLYVQCDDGSLYIYDLAADGKSVGSCVKSFTAAEMQTLLGATWSHMRVFEVTDDETHAFFSHHNNNSYQNVQLYVVWTAVDIRNLSASNVTSSSATLNGYLGDVGAATTVCALWGEQNGGANWGTWAHTNWWPAGAWTNNTYPATNLTGLAESTRYYYAFGATNAVGGSVAAPAVSFTTQQATDGPVFRVK